jgi:N-dimethylarginine dimethylaminohydrolase
MVYTRPDSDAPRPAELAELPLPQNVLMASPEHFQVEYSINPHMEGKLGTVDPDEAYRQWLAVRNTYDQLGSTVHVIEGAAGLPDMVFCANQTLPYRTPDGETGAVLSRMHAPERKPEVQHFEAFLRKRGYRVEGISPDVPGDFEGMGDALWHPGRFLLWGGHGFRTDLDVYEQLSDDLGVTVFALRLEDPDFYHLDTCLCPLDQRTALYFPGAFDSDGQGLLKHGFDRLIEAPEDEARKLFACNAHTPDGKHVIIQKGCTETVRRLEEAGFEAIEVDTGEFLKSGGSVFCMKVMFW